MDLTPITYEQVLALFAKTDAQIAENYKQMAETDKRLEKLMARTDEQIAETDELKTEVGKQFIVMSKKIAALTEQVSGITDTLGRFAEEQIRPSILRLFREKGIELEEIYPRVNIKKNGQSLLEIDLLLVNAMNTVAVEVKHSLRQKDVEDHLKRLAKLQESGHRIIQGTTIYGAISGIIVTNEVAQYAIKKGLYVIKPKGDNVEICNEKNFKPKTWGATAA